MKTSKILIIGLAVLSVMLPMVVFAVSGSPGGSTGIDNPLGDTDFTELINRIIGWLSEIGAGVAVIMIIWAGFMFMTAAGDEEKITKARKALTWALVGLAVFLMGQSWILLIKNILNQGVTPP